MAWTEPRIWVDGPHITAAQMNAVSENLRQTAPAKASAAGDIFFALGRNEIGVLSLGSVGQFLVPGSAAPQWDSVPTPITTRGDLVVGNATGEPSRFPASAGINIMVMQDGSPRWENEIFLQEWWRHEVWWSTDSSDDMTLGDGEKIDQHIIFGRDLSISGTITCSVSPVILRFRNITLGANASIVSSQENGVGGYDSGVLPSGSFVNGGGRSAGTSSGGRSGQRMCGGGGGSGSSNGSNNNGVSGSDGTDGTVSISIDDVKGILDLELTTVTGGAGASRARFNDSKPPGGVIIVACKSVTGAGRTLSVNASGLDGSNGLQGAQGVVSAGGGGGGGGGGVAIAVIADGTSNVSVNADGGSGGTGGWSSHVQRRAGDGGDGGDGSTYLGTRFPS